jgi:hypothetical protein
MRLSSLLTAVLLNKLILNTYICIFFTLIKSDDFQLCCAIQKKEEKNSRFIAATLYTVSFFRTGNFLSFLLVQDPDPHYRYRYRAGCEADKDPRHY